MYSVYGDGICIYNDVYLTGTINALTPKLNLADNTAGTLEITLPVGNAGYDKLKRLSSEIVVKRYDDEIWAGRIISEKKNFQNSRILNCEGELAYFNDTTQPPTEYDEYTVYNFIEALLKLHNSKVTNDKQFEMGVITVTAEDPISVVTNDEITLEIISEHLIDKFGGHIRIRRSYDEDGILHRFFDYLEDYPNTNGQVIRFGQNLLDFTCNWDVSEYATVIMPRGTQLDISENPSIDTYLDVSGATEEVQSPYSHPSESRYVFNDVAVETYGRIEVVVDWDDITDPNELLQKAVKYLEEEQFEDMVIEVSAVDLRYLSKDVQPINLLDEVRCISHPHGMNKLFAVTELSIQLDNPTNSTYTLSDTEKVSSPTTSAKNANTGIIERIAENERTVLDKAKANATSIMNMATQGYVTIIKDKTYSECLTISSERANVAYDPKNNTWKKGTKLWKWNINGLAYFDYDKEDPDCGVAITMDGAIAANFITTGTMSADRIRTGILEDNGKNTKWDLTNGILTMKKGSITLGNGLFSVTDGGYLTAVYGKIGGFTITASDISNSTIQLDANGMSFYYNGGDCLGTYGTSYWAKNPLVKGLVVNMENGNGYLAWAYKDYASANTYTIKLMYNSVELTADDNSTFVRDRLHLGAYMQLDRCGFAFKYGNTEYESFTLTTSNSNKKPLKIQLPYDLKKDGTSLSWGYVDCYICNGVIMM